MGQCIVNVTFTYGVDAGPQQEVTGQNMPCVQSEVNEA